MEQMLNIKQFLDYSGKITQLPQKYKVRYALLEYLAGKFETDCSYTERDLNDICNQWHTFEATFY